MDALRFAVIGDLHVGAADEHVGTAIRLASALDVDFVLFLGDLVNTPTDENLDQFARQVRLIEKPVYLAIGNHDMARAEEGYDVRARIAAALPGPWSESFTYAFRAKGWNFIVGGISTMSIPYVGPQINHVKGYVSETGGMIYMPPDDLARFLRLLDESGERPTAIVIHTPLVRMSPRLRRRGCFSQVRLLEEPGLMSVIEERANVRLFLYGHEHFNQVEVVDGRLHCTTQGVCGYPPYGDPDAIRLIEIGGPRIRSRLVWENSDPHPPAPIGTLQGDVAFQWEFDEA